MKYFKQFLIILSVSFLGEVLHALLPLPVPASIYGLVLMLAALCTGLLKLPQIEKTGLFLVDIMAVMFIPGYAAADPDSGVGYHRRGDGNRHGRYRLGHPADYPRGQVREKGGQIRWKT